MVHKPKRDPAIGKHWLAWYAFQGDEDLEFIREYVTHARKMLGAFNASSGRETDRETAVELAGLNLFLIALEMAMSDEGPSVFKVEIKRRKRGKPINRRDRALDGHRAAAIVEKAVDAGIKQEAAIAEASECTGLSRSEIFTWLQKRRRDRAEYGARQEEIEGTTENGKPAAS